MRKACNRISTPGVESLLKNIRLPKTIPVQKAVKKCAFFAIAAGEGILLSVHRRAPADPFCENARELGGTVITNLTGNHLDFFICACEQFTGSLHPQKKNMYY
jgi:hypothetical protein